MISGIYEAIDGSIIQRFRFNTVANNLANINTKAFKKEIVSFDEALTMKYFSTTDLTPGPVRYTGNELDVALGDQGFFKIQTPKGIRYTRDGSFSLNADQMLVTQNGDIVLGKNGPIEINGNNVSIKTSGEVLVDNKPVNNIAIMNFKNLQLLRKEGNSLYTYQGNETDIFTAENINVKQNHIESSNVNSTEEMVNMLDSLRAFEAVQKAIQSIDEITDKIVNDMTQ